MNAPNSPDSRTITFYSYKGGSGRSMALANVAWLLACGGHRVLVIDWDLEAPGLHRYFAPFLADPLLTRTRGVIDLVWELAAEASAEVKEDDDPRWYEPLADFRRAAVSLDYEFPAGGGIDFVPAGCQNSVYSERVTTFDWNKFYLQNKGGVILEAARRKARRDYAYILIDSRTGVSDTSGICTVQMPDLLVLCFTANNQSIKGAANIAKSVRAQWAANPETRGSARRILPLFTRVDGFERDRLDRRRALARAEFAEQLRGTDGLMELPYIPVYSYEETLAVFRDRPEDREAALLPGIERLTDMVSGGTVKGLKSPPNDTQRRRALARFEGREDSETEAASRLLESSRFDAFISYAESDGPAVAEIERRLHEENLRMTFAPQVVESGAELRTHFDAALAASSSMVVFIGPSGVQASQNVALLSAIDRIKRSLPGEFSIIPVFLPGIEPGGLHLPAMLRALPAINFRDSLDEEQTLVQLVAAIRSPVPPRTRETVPEDPYKGLESFRPEDAKYFFAREMLTETLLYLVRESPKDADRLVWVMGASGSGKTSLLNAGLLPRLAQGAIAGSSDWRTVVVRFGARPAEDLARAIVSLRQETSENLSVESEAKIASGMLSDPWTLASAACRAASLCTPATKIVLIVDQFEEIFTMDDADARKACIENLVRAADDPDGPVVVVVIAMRSDYVQQRDSFPPLMRPSLKRCLTVGPLTTDGLRTAIVRPAQMVGCEFEQGLVELLLRDTEGQAEALPLLQLVLQELWEGREGRRLTVSAYLGMKGLPGVVAAQASKVLERFTDEHDRQLSRRIFLGLVNVGEDENVTKKRVPLASLIPDGEFPKEAHEVIRKWVDARLLTVQSEANGQETVEIVHDALMEQWEPLRTWIEASRKNLRARTVLAAAAREWQASGERTDLLYTAAQTYKIREAIGTPTDLPEPEATFLRRSSTYITLTVRRNMLIGLGLVVLAVASYFVTPLIHKYEAVKSLGQAGFTWHEDSKTLEISRTKASSISDLSAVSESAPWLEIKVLDLTGCSHLQDVSALHGVQTLEVLSLDDCGGLQNVDGLGNLAVLQILTLERCENLQSIDGLKSLRQLRFVDLQGCRKLAPQQLSDLRIALPNTAIRQPEGGLRF